MVLFQYNFESLKYEYFVFRILRLKYIFSQNFAASAYCNKINSLLMASFNMYFIYFFRFFQSVLLRNFILNLKIMKTTRFGKKISKNFVLSPQKKK